jgi:hypothetical protein
MVLRAAVRDITRPAPCEHDSYESAFPSPRTMNEACPIAPAMSPRSAYPARIAPLRVTNAFRPSSTTYSCTA